MYELIFFVFLMTLSFFTFLKYENENIKDVLFTYSLSLVFNKIKKTICIVLDFLFFWKKSSFKVKKVETRKQELIRNKKTKKIKDKFSDIFLKKRKFVLKWNYYYLNFFFVAVLLIIIEYSIIFLKDISLLSYILFFLAFIIFSLLSLLEFGYEHAKKWIFIISSVSLICSFSAPYFTIDYIVKYSDVSPEKIVSLISYSSVIFMAYMMLLIMTLIQMSLMIFLFSYRLYFDLFNRLDFFKEVCKENSFRVFHKNGKGSSVLIVLFLFLGLISIYLKFIGSPTEVYRNFLADTFFSENDSRCKGSYYIKSNGGTDREKVLLNSDEIYFYEINRVVKYSREKDAKVKFKDVKCTNKK